MTVGPGPGKDGGTGGGVVLFGPPTAGKDTISAALARRDARFGQLPKVKVGSGRAAGYRMATRDELVSLRSAGRVVLETERYGNTYAIDRADMDAMRAGGGIPVVHMGSVDHLRSFTAAVEEPWLCVLLWVPRVVCGERSRGRGDHDTADRLAAWDEALADLAAVPEDERLFHLLVRSDHSDPDRTAELVETFYARPGWEYARPGGLSELLEGIVTAHP
ncbi:guanylate kinase [Streptomyces sp. NPDC058619]|uniref:guanylate kinase n=1 Tax=unclassified Streptomyces TaxID=2593676 RepID=UPI00365929C3